jgi:2-dehydropantoate 2-reductase
MMRIAVFGAGGVGGYFGGRLAQAGEDVVFIARGAHLEAMRTAGLLVDSLKGDFSVRPVQATDVPAEVGRVDAVLVAVKAWQVPEAAHAIQPMLGEETFVVPLQNGVEAPEQLSAVLGKECVLGGLCHIVSYIAGPGYIKHAGIEPHIAFGEMEGGKSERAEALKAAFDRAGVWAEAPEDIQAAMWEKFLFIAAISGVGAVTRAPAGLMRRLPETRRLLENAMKETFAVGRARGVNLPADVVERTLAFVDNLPEGATASMQRDIMEGRPSELHSQNGAVVRLGAEADAPTPIHAYIYHALLPQELRARGEVDF